MLTVNFPFSYFAIGRPEEDRSSDFEPGFFPTERKNSSESVSALEKPDWVGARIRTGPAEEVFPFPRTEKSREKTPLS